MTGWQWHQLDHMQIICTALQADNYCAIFKCYFTCTFYSRATVGAFVCLVVLSCCFCQAFFYKSCFLWQINDDDDVDDDDDDDDNDASTSPLSFYRPDAFSAAQPTASKH